MMYPIVNECIKKYGGGEAYFTEIDAMIKSNDILMSEYIQYITEKENIYNVILSGEIGMKYGYLWLSGHIPEHINLFVLPGGLRKNPNILDEIIKEEDCNCKEDTFLFLDDSYYSGRTLQAVNDYVQKAGCTLQNSYVFYDGSPLKNDNVYSLYRYYDNLEN